MLNDFFTFVRSQPVDREIGGYNTWNNCAVGDFIKESLGRGLRDNAPIPSDICQKLLEKLNEQYPGLYRRMNKSAHRSYGALQKELP